VTIFRDTTVYLEAPGDINNPPGTYAQMAAYWYPQLADKWLKNIADYYTITNEQGGNDRASYENLVAYEREVMKLANADGFKVCILNLATGSPEDFSLWADVCAPFILEAWAAGNIYGRHVYSDGELVDSNGTITSGNASRPIEELAYLQSQGGNGGLAIGECGLQGGYAPADATFFTEMTTYENALQDYPDIIGIAMWNLGNWQSSGTNWQGLTDDFAIYMNANPTPKWEPGDTPPPPSEETFEQQAWRESVEEQIARGIPLNPDAGLQQAIFNDDLVPVHREIFTVHDDIGYTVQAGEHLTGAVPRRVYVYQPGQSIYYFEEPDDEPEPADFYLTHWPASTTTITQGFGDNPQDYADYGLPGHNGIDIYSPLFAPFYAAKSGRVAWVSDQKPDGGASAYGWHVRIDHDRYRAIYAHAEPNPPVQVGQIVSGGDVIAHSGNTGNSTGPHLHFELRRLDGAGDPGWPWGIIDPTPYLMPLIDGPPPQPGTVNVLSFMFADPEAWRVVRQPSGAQEDIQDMDLGGGAWVRRKNDNGEWWKADTQFAYLIHDTSPAPGSQGIDRLYTLYKNNIPGAPKNPISMNVGQTWTESGSHLVQFRARADCGYLEENSGHASNTCKLTRYEQNGYVFNAYGQNLHVDEAIWLQTGVETQVYAKKDGRVIGWCGWSSPWGSSEIVELYFNRGVMTEEPPRYCSW
jgi:murein DD-endopeptidase MepM/ murein hydrolase activator NlpD